MSGYGLGFMETWSERYAPQFDLAGTAVRMADLIDGVGPYVVDGLHLSSLPAVWFGRTTNPTADIPTTGCVSIYAPHKDASQWGRALLVFFAEVADAHAAAALVARAETASIRERPTVAGSEGRLLFVVIGGSSTLGQEAQETEASLGRIRDGLLREVAP